jgi:hypothetical protein
MIVVRRGSCLQIVRLFTFVIDYKTGKITPVASLKMSDVCRQEVICNCVTDLHCVTHIFPSDSFVLQFTGNLSEILSVELF